MTEVVVLKEIALFRGHQTILDNISWVVKKGEHWAVVGANGAGKTSLLRIVAGYLWPSKGEVKLLGKRYGECDLRELKRQIGWISQELLAEIPPAQRVINTVISGKYASLGLWVNPEKEDYERASLFLERLGIAHLAQRPFATLSQGEKQRTLLARALMAKPALLVLDEPLSGLYLTAREQILLDLEKIASLTTLVLVTHHIEEITPLFTHVLLLKEGRVLAQGKKEKVLTSTLLSQGFDLNIHVQKRFGRFWVSVNHSTKSSQW